MKNLCLISICFFAVAIGANAQDTQTDCPPQYVCLSPQTARKAITDDATVKAQVEQIKTLQQAVQDEKANTHKVELDYAEKVGENTQLKQTAVRTDAIIELLLKNTKKKCMPFSVLCL